MFYISFCKSTLIVQTGDNLIYLNIDPFRLPEWPTIQDIPQLIGLDLTSVITTALTTLATIRKELGKSHQLELIL